MEGYVKDTSQPVIGAGAYGVVYRVRSRRTGEEFALKCHTHGAEDATVRELSCLAALRGHPNIIQLLDCFMDEGSTVAMLMPYVPYTLSTAIHAKIPNDRPGGTSPLTRPRIPLSFVASFSSQTANALAYMHRLNLIHRDIAPNNLLLTEDLTVKVADLGLARQSSRRMSLSVVTEPYRAPELFAAGRTAEYTCAIDVWSLGAVIADAMEGKVVFLRSGLYSTFDMIVGLLLECPDRPEENATVALNRNQLVPNLMSCEPAKRVALSLLAFQASERLTAEELLGDAEWMALARMTEEEKATVLERCKSAACSQV